MKIEAKQRLIDSLNAELVAAGFTFDEGAEPVENMGGVAGPGTFASVDDDSKLALERQLSHMEELERTARDPQIKQAYSRVVSELKRALSGDAEPLAAAQGEGPMADTVEANDTHDFMNMTVSDPGNAPPVQASEEAELESEQPDPIGDGEEFNLLIDGDPSQKEPEVSELTQNDGGIQPPTDQPLLLDDVNVTE